MWSLSLSFLRAGDHRSGKTDTSASREDREHLTMRFHLLVSFLSSQSDLPLPGPSEVCENHHPINEFMSSKVSFIPRLSEAAIASAIGLTLLLCA